MQALAKCDSSNCLKCDKDGSCLECPARMGLDLSSTPRRCKTVRGGGAACTSDARARRRAALPGQHRVDGCNGAACMMREAAACLPACSWPRRQSHQTMPPPVPPPSPQCEDIKCIDCGANYRSCTVCAFGLDNYIAPNGTCQ